jgi:hypothetical protein
MEDEEILYKEEYELLVIFRGRTRAPWNWKGVTGGLPYRTQLTPQGLMLVITTELLEEARRLLRLIHQEPSWRAEVRSPLIRKKQIVTKWISVPPEEWATDYFEQEQPMIERPFSQSLGILPEPKPLSHKELPASTMSEQDVADRQHYHAPGEEDLGDDERRLRTKHRRLEHEALMPTEVLRKEAEDEAAWQIRKARYEREAEEERTRREQAEREQRIEREERTRRLHTGRDLYEILHGKTPPRTDVPDEPDA